MSFIRGSTHSSSRGPAPGKSDAINQMGPRLREHGETSSRDTTIREALRYIRRDVVVGLPAQSLVEGKPDATYDVKRDCPAQAGHYREHSAPTKTCARSYVGLSSWGGG